MPQPTTADNTKSFADVMCELSNGMKLLIDRLNYTFDVGSDLDMEVGSYVMDAIIATQWIAQRLSEDIHTLGLEFDGTRSEAAEASR
jgi:hypothetical protein